VSNNLDTDSLLKLMRATEERGDYRPKLAQVKVPVLVAQGEEDLLIPPSTAQEVAAAIPGARFVIIEKAGHTLNLEAIPQVTKLVRAHLENCFHQ
jgi:3-oxoadipate enol-lactonase